MNFMRIFHFMVSVVDRVTAYPDTPKDKKDLQVQTRPFFFSFNVNHHEWQTDVFFICKQNWQFSLWHDNQDILCAPAALLPHSYCKPELGFLCRFSPCPCGHPPYSPVSSHFPETCWQVECYAKLSVWEIQHVCSEMDWTGVSFHFMPKFPRTGSTTLTRMEWLLKMNELHLNQNSFSSPREARTAKAMTMKAKKP